MLIEKEVVSAVIGAVPPGWACLRGMLFAPRALINSGEVSVSTHFVFGVSIHQMVDKTEPGVHADIFGVLVQGRKPSSITFGQNGGCCEVMPLEQSKAMAVHFILLGYRGRLQFDRREGEYLSDPPDFRCEILMRPGASRPGGTSIWVERNCEEIRVKEKSVCFLKRQHRRKS
ncbi:MAG: hypothetical protein KGJ13_06060 [Patescibacteria group bacterium]|nr:hypothetical protein [Patescibacteria group bacterium]